METHELNCFFSQGPSYAPMNTYHLRTTKASKITSNGTCGKYTFRILPVEYIRIYGFYRWILPVEYRVKPLSTYGGKTKGSLYKASSPREKRIKISGPGLFWPGQTPKFKNAGSGVPWRKFWIGYHARSTPAILSSFWSFPVVGKLPPNPRPQNFYSLFHSPADTSVF